MNPLLELADRVEAATGPDQELDAAIHGAVGDEFRQMQIERLGAFGPAYSASLDAAMTLVPEDTRWCVDTCEGKPRSFVEPRDPSSLKSYVASAASAALALTAVSLRAIASMGSSGE